MRGVRCACLVLALSLLPSLAQSQPAASVITVENVAVLSAQLRNGANATSTTLGFTPETANSVSVIAGSVCQVRVYL